jgi:hypothetical protein
MPPLSIADKVMLSGKPFTIFHTSRVTESLLAQAIDEHRSMDLDTCVTNAGKPYLGHSEEYHEKTGEPFLESSPIWEAVDLIAQSDIFALVDCKHYDAVSIVDEVIARIGPERCLLHAFVSELKLDYSRGEEEPDFLTEWLPIVTLSEFKMKYPGLTTTASAKWAPRDLLTNPHHKNLLEDIRKVLKDHRVDTVYLNVPYDTISDMQLRYFLAENIIPQFSIDGVDVTRLSQVYVGTSDILEHTSIVDRLQEG